MSAPPPASPNDKRVYVLVRQLTAKNGTAISVPLVAYDKEVDAKEAVRTMRDAFEELAQGTIICDIPGRGPQPISTVMNFIAQLGICQVEFTYYTADVKSAFLLSARTPLVTAH